MLFLISIIEIIQTKDGEKFKYVNGEEKKLSSSDQVIQDENGSYIIDTSGEDTITRVYQEDLTDVESENSAIEEPLTPETPATEDDNLPSFSDLGVDGTINQ